MFDRACLVSLSSEKAADVTSSASGLLLDSKLGYVLTHSSIFLPFVEDDKRLRQQIFEADRSDVSVLGFKYFKSVKVQVRMAKSQLPENKLSVLTQTRNKISSKSYSPSVMSSTVLDVGCSYYPGYISCVFKCLNFSEALRPLLKGGIGDASSLKKKENQTDGIERDAHLLSSLLPFFALVQLEHWKPYDDSLSLRPARECCIGERIQLCGTPFGDLGPGVFFNSISEGVISGLNGRAKSLLLTDARSVPGSEGGPAYTFLGTEKYLTGIVASSLCWAGSEWVSFCIVCSVDEIIGSLPGSLPSHSLSENDLEESTVLAAGSRLQEPDHAVRAPTKNLQRLVRENETTLESNQHKSCSALCSTREIQARQSLVSPAKPKFSGIAPEVLASVVCVNNGGTWGSGVIISCEEKLILTCSHVVEKHQGGVTVTVKPGQASETARVLYHCHPPVPLDLALLSCPTMKSAGAAAVPDLDLDLPHEGSRVFIVGFGVFRDDVNMGPLVTGGVVSKVVRVNGSPVMIQTTGAVHPGCSGGAVISAEGKLVGIAVCNVKDLDSATSFPHVNLSIPISAAWPVLRRYILHGDVSILENLQMTNPLVHRLWALKETSSASDTSRPGMSKL